MKLKALLAVACCIALFSCKKDRNQSMRDYLHGSWRLVQIGLDTNHNEMIDLGEVVSIPDTGIINTVFNADGTGHGAINLTQVFSINGKFHWSVDDAAQVLKISTDDSTTYTAKFKATNYNNFSLLHQQVRVMGRNLWTVYSRQ